MAGEHDKAGDDDGPARAPSRGHPERSGAADSPDRLTAADEKTIASKVRSSIERALR